MIKSNYDTKTNSSKSFEGGWRPWPQDFEWSHFSCDPFGLVFYNKKQGSNTDVLVFRYAEVIADSTFWQSLGKSCGWPDIRKTTYSKTEWEWQALEFTRLILTNQPTDTFWQEIINAKE